MDMLYNPQTWVILTVIFFILLVATQCFFCLRISFWPGLLMPGFFLCIWIYFQLGLNFLPIEDIIGATDHSHKVFTSISLMGILFSLLLYGIIRTYLYLRKRVRAQRRKERLSEKQRILTERQASGSDNTVNTAAPHNNSDNESHSSNTSSHTSSPGKAARNPAAVGNSSAAPKKTTPSSLDLLKQQLAEMAKEKHSSCTDERDISDTREINLP